MQLVQRRMTSAWLAILLLAVQGIVVGTAQGQESGLARGVVYHDQNGNQQRDAGEPGLAGIRVSNGQEVVLTNEQGEYQLPVSDDTILFVIKPRGWATPLSPENLPRFYYIHKPNGSPPAEFAGVAPTGPLPESVDFPLTPQEEADKFQVLLFGDTQPRDQKEVDWVIHDVVEELVGLKTKAVFGITLGDISFDDLNTFEPLNRGIAKLGIPWINVMGNHDVNYDAPNRELANETFERVYGPSYYSFDYGPVHFVVLDDIDTLHNPERKRSTYRGGFGPRQLKFLENDLKFVPENQLVVLLMHIPIVDSTPMHDRDAFFRVIEKREHCISFSAHSHRQKHDLIGEKDNWQGAKPHHHMNLGTVCGSWWSGGKDERGIPHATQYDGTPNGYSFLNINGAEYTVDFRAAGRPAGYQMQIDAPEVVTGSQTAQTSVYANFFSGTEKSVLKMQVAGGDWQTMQAVAEVDPVYKRMVEYEQSLLEGKNPAPFRKLPNPRVCTHLWKLELPENLPAGTHLIRILATDHWGREFEGNRTIRVE